MAKEGLGILFALVFSSLCLLLGWRLSGNFGLFVSACIIAVLALFTIYFFRDPNRNITSEEGIILSPGDGRIIEISRVHENEYLSSDAAKIAIFLSVFNVHINRVPIGGDVEFMQYKRGKFLPASQKRASTKNEQTVIGIKSKYGKVLFKQIAGILARRIICYLREGHRVETGEKFGMIKFGSRLEVYLPDWAEVQVKVGDKVKGGLTRIAKANQT